MTNSHRFETGGSRFAVIGIGCRLPGRANDHRAFWNNLVAGLSCITETPASRYDVATLGSRDQAKPGRLVGGRGGYIDGFDEFDPAFFGISPREAAYMDPQQRKMLEVTWEALEDAGQKPSELAGRNVGVFIGAFTLDYKIVQFADLSFETLAAHTATGTMMTMISNRISYCFDFRGPSMSIDTACSSSLVAIHLACQSLRSRESCIAVAGGVLLQMTPQYTIGESKGGFLSPEGQSRTFDAGANGYVRAEGAAVVVLKPFEDAVRDGDPIHAVILGTGVNQDGRTNGITVPNGEAQVGLVRRVCREAGISPGALHYVEAHGTSTAVGDPIEANALGTALADGRPPGARCYVGSVKTNIGHTESAAGVAGLIKTALSLEHKLIPPHINLERVNPAIDLASLPIEFPTRLTAWPAHDGPARAGVNSFGFGGTNSHVVLEEPPRNGVSASLARHGFNILPVTVRDPAQLPERVAALAAEIDGASGAAPALADLGYTLARRRQHLESRLSFVYESPAELRALLASYLAGEASPRIVAGSRLDERRRRLVWVFTGMGPQWWAMGRQLAATEPVYREMIERCDREIGKLAGWSLIEELGAAEGASNMAQTWLAQPANFAVQVALAALWRSLGVVPDAIVGHSTGEVAAFYEAGVYSFEDAIKIAIHRSRLQQRLVGTGTMLAVGLSEQDAAARIAHIADRVAIGAANSPTAVTLSGDADALRALCGELQADQVFARFLQVPIPYHSPAMDRIRDDLLASLADIDPRPAKLPLYLTAVCGTSQGHRLDAAYWWHNVRDTVRFRAAIDRIIDDDYSLFLEIGPHPVLGNAIVECLTARGVEGKPLASLRRQDNEPAQVMTSLAALHNLGVEIAWDRLYAAGHTVPLPRYPWKRERYWVEPAPVEQVRLGRLDHELLGRRLPSAEPTWEIKLDVEKLPYLADHRIQGNAVFPAAGYLEMAMQAVRSLTSATTVALADIEIRKAMFVPEHEARTVQLALGSEGSTFRIASLTTDGDSPVHATGTVRQGPRRTAGPLDAAGCRARATRQLDAAACYAALAEMGYHYGPAFQGIESIWISPDGALARVRAPEVLGGSAARYHLHPCLLDACFQTLLAPEILHRAPGTAAAGSTGIRLPLSIEEVRVSAVGDQPLWVHAQITARSADEMVGDIAIYGDAGAPLGAVTRFRAANVEKSGARVGLSTIDGWLFDVAWRERDALPAEAAAAPEAGTDGEAATEPEVRQWVIFADAGGVGAELAARAAARGDRACLVRPGDRFAIDGGRRTATIDPSSPADAEALIGTLARTGDQTRLVVVHLWNLDHPALSAAAAPAAASLPPLRVAGHRGAYSLVAAARALLASEAQGSLVIATRGAQAVVPGAAVEPLGAPAWGVARVLRYQELPAWRGKIIDLDPGPDPGRDPSAEADLVLRELAFDDEHEVAVRGGRRFTPRLAPAKLAGPLPVPLRADGTYLVTGAFGALGRLLCRHLVRRGARRLVVMGRTRLPDRTTWHALAPGAAADCVRFVQDLEALGAQVIVAPVDVTDEAALSSWLSGFRTLGYPALRGVFHAAGQVRDTLVGQMDRDTFDAVYDPKVVGSFLLHKHTAADPLDHFVVFSSIASLMTTAGQTNYAAGNAFLDALAHHRRAAGLPALSIDWGPWATGMIAELGLIEHYRNNRGMSCLAPNAGIDVLDRILGQDRAQFLVATVVDWPVFLAWYPVLPTLVADVSAGSAAPAAREGGSFLELFRATAEAERYPLVAERFTAVVAHVLRASAAQIDAQTTLNALGLDSLLAIELRNRVVAELGPSLPVVTLLSGATVDKLTGLVHASLTEAADLAADTAAPTAEAEVHSDETCFPLTQNQKALWFLKQLDPDGFAYNIGGAVEVEVETPLDPELMLAAVRALIQRHPMLRARYLLEDGRPVQRIAPEIRPDFALFDVQGDSWDSIYRAIIREYRKPYDLEHDPLLRFRMFKRGERRFILMKAVHHIISDAISTFTFIEELLAVYDALRKGQPAALPPVRASYLDFLNWQNRLLASRDAQRMERYWLDHLPPVIPTLNLPTDKPRPVVQTHNGASHFFVLPADLTARVHALSRATGATHFMILLAAYYLLLHRYTAQDDIIVGSPVMGRTASELSATYGYFVNPLPLHANLTGDPTFLALLDQVRTIVLGGLDHQEYPFVMLVEKLGLHHDPSRSAVFQAMFILLVHRVATQKYGIKLDYIELPEEEGQFDLTLSAYEDEDEHALHCVLKYNSDLFHAETIARMASHYAALLDSVTTDPSLQLSAHRMLGAVERAQIVERWSGAPAAITASAPVHALISRRASARPDALAVIVPSRPAGPAGSGEPAQTLSYGELDARANQLARRLAGLGIADGDVVAVCLEKSPELIIALVAILKTGAAYLPIDPEYPEDRIAYMVHNAGARFAIVDDADRHPQIGATPIAIGEALRHCADADPTSPADPVDPGRALDATAYVIYTSGSTGRPKGVRVTHRNLASAYRAWESAYRLGELRVHLQMASFAFDVFSGDLVRALCSGAALCLVRKDLLLDPARLHGAMVRHAVDAAEFVPAIARALAMHCRHSGARLDFMKLFVVGSDVWKVEEFRQLRTLLDPGARLINSYGLTEATIDTTYFEGTVDDLEPGRMVPIGAPFPGSRVYVLDPHGAPVPAGVPGELWVGGSGVAAEYVGDPAQTAARFASVALGDAGAMRLYRTGDLAHWDARGTLHLCGRADGQVKVRGHRIETAEIESQLVRLPDVASAAVVARPDATGETVLCAYCVAAPGAALDARVLREHLSTTLPTFMIPTHLLQVDAFPLSANGKVDLAALPVPERTAQDGGGGPPRSHYEVRVAEHWKHLLGVPHVGRDHDFFELGGSSIKLIELIYRLQSELDVAISVSQLFKVSTLVGMARAVEDVARGRDAGDQPYLRFNTGQGKTIYCFPPAGGHGLVYRRLAEHMPEHAFVSFNYLAGENKVERYADLIEAIQNEGPCVLFGYSLGGNLAFEVAKELERRGREVPNVVIMDSYRIKESFELTDLHLVEFERELRAHLRKHTGSDVVERVTLDQAKEYIHFCNKVLNNGVITAPVSIISDEDKAANYEVGQYGTWHGSSATRTSVFRGHGKHADMLDGAYVARNAEIARNILGGGAS